MPIGILIINLMKKYPFHSVGELNDLIDKYFEKLEPEDDIGSNLKKQKKEIAPPTMSGLAYHLGFESVQSFEACEAKGRYTTLLKRARLRVEAEYEKKLHFQSSTGAIFALKSMGWNGRLNSGTSEEPANNTFRVKVVTSGPILADSEKNVIL